MKAILFPAYGLPEKACLGEAPQPAPNADQVLVQVHAASVNHIDRLKAAGGLQQAYPLQFPWIPGQDFAGTVVVAGSKVTQVKVGDAVYGEAASGGAYAEYVVVPASAVALKPASLSFVAAAAVPMVAGTAWQALFEHGQLQPGQTVLIHGAAGSVGACAVQLAHQHGAIVLATASKADQPYVKSLGADLVLDYQRTRFEHEVRSVDLVLDLVGGEVQRRSYQVLRPGGCLVATNQPPSLEEAAQYKVRATFMHNKTSHSLLTHLAEMIDRGQLQVQVARVYPLAEMATAWQDAARHLSAGEVTTTVSPHELAPKAAGKIILQVSH